MLVELIHQLDPIPGALACERENPQKLNFSPLTIFEPSFVHKHATFRSPLIPSPSCL